MIQMVLKRLPLIPTSGFFNKTWLLNYLFAKFSTVFIFAGTVRMVTDVEALSTLYL